MDITSQTLPATGRGTKRSLLERVLRLARARRNGFGSPGPLHHAASRRGPPPRAGEDQAGFTLVELMVVIVILGLLATIVVINVTPSLDKSAVTKTKADIATLEQGLEMYRLNTMRYPTTDQGLQSLVAEGYVKRLPDDPWGNPYRYQSPGGQGRAFDVFSYGADGRQGGENENADLGNWDS